MEKQYNIYELRQGYEKFRRKYKLPDFYEMNKLFDIEEIEDGEFLLRKIRRVISEKIVSYLRFIEIILNPANAPMFFFKLVKKLDNEDKKILGDVYEKLGEFEVEAVGLDLDYDENNEAKFIKKAYDVFCSDIKDKLLRIIGKLSNVIDKKREKNDGYFG